MPRANTILRGLTLAALSLSPAWAHALCQPMAASGQRETVVADVSLHDTNTLLALDGARIKIWEPLVGVEIGRRAAPVIWAERVDWSVYAAAPDTRIGPTLLRFERGADGVRHLCAIAQYSPNLVEKTLASGQAPLPKPEAETRFLYENDGRLYGYELRSYAHDGTPNTPLRYCFRYDGNGWLAERSANACNEPPQPLARYVHDAAGRLLRTISYVENQGDAIEVVVYDGDGNPAQRYRRQRLDWKDEKLTLGLPFRERPSEYAVLVLPGPNWKAPAMESNHYDWAIVQPKGKGSGQDIYEARRDPASVLASGNSGADGQFDVTPAQRQRIWDAAGQTPGGVQWLWAPGQTYTLLQALPKAVWAACTDPENRQPEACGAH